MFYTTHKKCIGSAHLQFYKITLISLNSNLNGKNKNSPLYSPDLHCFQSKYFPIGPSVQKIQKLL